VIKVPDSVLAYFQQPAVQTAVDLLLAKREPKVPESLRWDEVSSFYRACLAARQVPIEFASFCEELWRGVWGEPPAGWKSAVPSRPDRPDLDVGPTTVWNEGCFTRRFVRGNLSLELAVGLWTDNGIQIGVVLYDEEEEVILDEAPLRGWAQEGYDMYWNQGEISPLAAQVDLEPFRPWTTRAWQAIDNGLG
jgi:hypothetical protein